MGSVSWWHRGGGDETKMVVAALKLLGSTGTKRPEFVLG